MAAAKAPRNNTGWKQQLRSSWYGFGRRKRSLATVFCAISVIAGRFRHRIGLFADPDQSPAIHCPERAASSR